MGKEKEILDNAEYEVQQGLSEVKRLINSMGNYSGGMLVRPIQHQADRLESVLQQIWPLGMEGSSYTIRMISQPLS